MPWLSAACTSSGTVSARSSAAGPGTVVPSESRLRMLLPTQTSAVAPRTSQTTQAPAFCFAFAGCFAVVIS